MSDIEYQFEPIALEYGAIEADHEMSKYELTNSWPSIVEYLPLPPARVMDYGCGSGVYSKLLVNLGYEVTATDIAPTMVTQARNEAYSVASWSYKDGPFGELFDVVVAKLVVQFVDDLPKFAAVMKGLLQPKRVLIISVPHPDKSRDLANITGRYQTSIGTSGLVATMIHRELTDYVSIFAAEGLTLDRHQSPTYEDRPGESPKRLIMLFSA